MVIVLIICGVCELKEIYDNGHREKGELFDMLG